MLVELVEPEELLPYPPQDTQLIASANTPAKVSHFMDALL
jgi:hypothetical protein